MPYKLKWGLEKSCQKQNLHFLLPQSVKTKSAGANKLHCGSNFTQRGYSMTARSWLGQSIAVCTDDIIGDYMINMERGYLTSCLGPVSSKIPWFEIWAKGGYRIMSVADLSQFQCFKVSKQQFNDQTSFKQGVTWHGGHMGCYEETW